MNATYYTAQKFHFGLTPWVDLDPTGMAISNAEQVYRQRYPRGV